MAYEINNTVTYRVTGKDDNGNDAPASTATLKIVNNKTEATVLAETSILANREGTSTYYYKHTYTSEGAYRVTIKYTIGTSTRQDTVLTIVIGERDGARA